VCIQTPRRALCVEAAHGTARDGCECVRGHICAGGTREEN